MVRRQALSIGLEAADRHRLAERGEAIDRGLVVWFEAPNTETGETYRMGQRLTLRLAEAQGFAHVSVQCRTLEAAYAALDGDYQSMSRASNAALASAAANGPSAPTPGAAADRLVNALISLGTSWPS